MRVEIRSNLDNLNLDDSTLELLCTLLKNAAKEEGCRKGTEVSLFFTDDATIKKYNSKYRHIDKATDVLSFPMFQGREIRYLKPLSAQEPVSLGDIIISLERCREQAVEYDHSFSRELCFLALHGFLHLLGYDHMTSAEAEEMEATAEKYLTSLGVTR
ncbi:MAG: rRNA maturation RNase YbeY [Bacillota bacterium]|nr:rRNA maturation RNase YbeY [Bacillota bacterium]